MTENLELSKLIVAKLQKKVYVMEMKKDENNSLELFNSVASENVNDIKSKKRSLHQQWTQGKISRDYFCGIDFVREKHQSSNVSLSDSVLGNLTSSPNRTSRIPNWRLKSPLLPVRWPRGDFDNFQLVQQFDFWRNLLERRLTPRWKTKFQCHSDNKVNPIGPRIMQGSRVLEPTRHSNFIHGPKNELCSNLCRRPLGPESLVSSSCLKTMQLQDQTYLAYTSLNSVRVERLQLPEYKLEEHHSYELVNYESSMDELVYGFSHVEGSDLFLLRQRHAVSLVKLDGDIRNVWNNEESDIISSSHLGPSSDSFATINSEGTLSVRNLDNEADTFWESEGLFKDEVGYFEWANLSRTKNDFNIRLATRKQVTLFDLRDSAKRNLFQTANDCPTLEVISAIVSSEKSSSNWYCATTKGFYCFDDRRPGKPVRYWNNYFQQMWNIGDSLIIDDVEYVSFCSQDGYFVLIPHDYESESISCRPIRISALESVFNSLALSPTCTNFLQMPWIGLSLFTNENSGLTAFMSNAASMIFSTTFQKRENYSTMGSWLNTESNYMKSELKKSYRNWEKEVESHSYLKCTQASITSNAFSQKYIYRNRNIPWVAKKKEEKEKVELHFDPTFCYFKNSPKLAKVDVTKHKDEQGQRVHKIMQGEKIFPEQENQEDTVMANNENDEYLSQNSFLGDFEPFMTSTQQTNSQEIQPTTPFQNVQQTNDTFDSTRHSTALKNVKKKKKKKSLITGF